MLYAPTPPADGTKATAIEMRAQLNGLNDKIDAVPTLTSVVVDSVTTLPAGSPATVSVNIVAGVLHLTFEIPQGPPISNAVVDAVNTLNPEDPATVSASFDGTNVHLSFGIPRGQTGATGEVTNAALGESIAGTSSNTNAVALPGLAVSDPPTQAEVQVQALADKMDELIAVLRR